MSTSLLLQLNAGFSIGAVFLLCLVWATVYRSIDLPLFSRVGGYLMLVCFALSQAMHADLLPGVTAPSRTYAVALAFQSIGFYALFLGLLRPRDQVLKWPEACWMLSLICAASILPAKYSVPVVMMMSTVATAHLATLLRKLRAQRKWFHLELRMLILFAIMAVAVAVLGLASWQLGWRAFAMGYSTLITFSFLLVLYLLLRFPDLIEKAEVAVQQSYQVSTLQKVDRTATKARLEAMLLKDKLYQDEALSLSKLADAMELSTHQVSELINTEFDCSLSQLLRRYRVEAAKVMLIEEPRASVLSVGLAVGFGSQSNFYLAFREVTGTNPGQYRRQQLPNDHLEER